MSAPRRPSRSCIGLIILATATLFVPVRILHPLLMAAFLVLTRWPSACSASSSAYGRRLRATADHPAAHRHAAHLSRRRVLFDRHAAAVVAHRELFNPVVYLISGFRWSFYGSGDVSVVVSLAFTAPLHRGMPVDLVANIPHRLSAQALSAPACVGARGTRCEAPSFAGPGRRQTFSTGAAPRESDCGIWIPQLLIASTPPRA